MPADYNILAPVYRTIGMEQFAESMTPRLIDYAQRSDWGGRRILDLGCGAGATLEWLTRHSYTVTGVDDSPDMLEISRQRLEEAGLNHDLRQRDLREPGVDLGTVDLALALDVINELNSLRDLEIVFRNVHSNLNDGRLFIFDLHTIQGLAAQGQVGDEIVYDGAQLTVIARNDFDFERQLFERGYLVFHHDNNLWYRHEGKRSLRGYPTQVVATLLQRCGFALKHVTHLDFEDYEPGTSQANRIIIMAEKQ